MAIEMTEGDADSERRDVLLDNFTEDEPEEDFVEADIDNSGVQQGSADEDTEGLEPVKLGAVRCQLSSLVKQATPSPIQG